jgi:4-amino-4-deoxy-L-arabinose transferase-like glycosyltransferase
LNNIPPNTSHPLSGSILYSFLKRMLLPHKLLFWGGIALAVVIRIAALKALQESVYTTSLLWDEDFYHGWAQALIHGDAISSAYYEYAPLPAYFMAFVYKLLGPEILFIRYANILLGTGSCLLIYLISKQLAGKWYALAALYCSALCKPLIFYSLVPLKTSLSVFLFSLFVFLVLSNRQEKRWWNRIILGILFGLLFNVRPNVLILLPILPFLICCFSYQRLQDFIHLSKAGLLIAIGIILSASPFVVRHYQLTEQLRITPLQSGFLLFANNNYSNPSPYYQPVSFASSHPEEQGIQFTIEASKRAGRKMTTAEATDFWKGEVLTTITKAPWYWLKKMTIKVVSFLSFTEIDDHYHIGFISSIVPWFAYPLMPYWLFFLLGMTGLTAGTIQKRTRATVWPLALITFLYAVTLIIYSTGTRFQLPLLVIFIPVSIFTIKELLFSLQNRKLKVFFTHLLFLFVFMVAGLLPFQGKGPMATHYNTYAFLLNKNGQENEAIQWWEKSIDLHEPYSVYANLFLSGKYYHLYGMDKAVAILKDIPDQSFAAAAKYASLGDIFLHHGYMEQAREFYEKSLTINSGQRRVRQELIYILRHQNDTRLNQDIRQLRYISSFYE